MNYDAIDIADLKELFKDGNRSAGSNFSTLIDYFGSNAVKDNGDGTIEVNGKSVDITNIADFKPSDYAILSVAANFTGGLQKNGIDVATETDINTINTALTTGLATKVADNKDGTEQLNGVQVQPFNKLSDTIGGRNLLPGTSGTLQTVTNAIGWATNLPQITPVVTSVDSDTTYTASVWIAPASHDMRVQMAWKDALGTHYNTSGSIISAGTSGYSTLTRTFSAGSTIEYVTLVFFASQSTASTASYKEFKLEQGSIATDWTPAPEDKADDSKVVHNTGNEEIAGDKTFSDPVDVESSLFVQGAATLSTQPTNGTQVYPVYATADDDTDAQTLITTLQSAGFSGLIGIPES